MDISALPKRVGTALFSGRTRGVVFTVAGLFLLLQTAFGADPTFVGSLATALEPEVSEELGLDEETRSKLEEVVTERENQALELALSLKGTPQDERQAKIDAYVQESERLGLELLSDEQQRKLRQISVRRSGLKSLLQKDISEQLNLADWQKEQLASAWAASSGRRADAASQQAFERTAGQLLSPSQRAKWEELAGLSESEPIPAEQVVPPTRDAAGSQTAASSEAPSPSDAETPGTPQPAAPDLAADVAEMQNAPAKAESPQAASQGEEDQTLKFSFRFQPWSDVLDWFAEQADLSLVMDAPPPGTFNYVDGRSYTPSEAIDILNSVLLTKGYTLVRREKMLIVINLEDGIPPNLVTTVPAEELDERGKFELVSVLFDLQKMSAEEAEAEIAKLIGPQGSVVALTQSQQVFVTETAGRLRTIRDMIQAVENPLGSDVTVIEPEHAGADEVLAVVRQLLGMAEGTNTAEDGSVRFATDTLGTKIFVTGKRDAVEKVQKLVQQIDVPGGALGGGSPADQLQLEVYALASLDPAVTLQVMQTILAGNPDVRLAIDENTGNLIALARGDEHSTIKATLSQMQRDSKQVEVIYLTTVDPQMAVLSINKLFGRSGETPNPNAPIVDADPISGQLLVRGTKDQVDQIKDLLKKMGEDPEAALAAQAERGNIRTIPLSGNAAERLLNELEMLWPTVSENRIRVVRPSASAIRGLRSSRAAETPTARETPTQERQPSREVPSDTEATWRPTPKVHFVDYTQEKQPQPPRNQLPTVTTAQAPEAPAMPPQVARPIAPPEAPPTSQNAETRDPSSSQRQQPGEIVVMMGPSGLVIASEDQEALDQLEGLIETLAARYSASAEYSVYYLKYVKADVAAAMLQSILTGTTPDTGSDGGSLMGDIASEMLGGGGGLMGSLMGLGSSSSSVSLSGGSLSIIPDMRLNALVVQASVEDLDKIDQLLEIMDQPHSPDKVETKRTPRMIPVLYTSAEQMANLVRQVYADRIAGGGGNGQQQQRQPSPEDFIRALRGGRGGRDGGGGGGGAQSEPEKMTLGVDTRSNALVVSAPDPLFEEVKALVEELDQAGDDSNQSMRVVRVRSSNPATIQQALSSLTGQPVTVNSTSPSDSNQASSSNNNSAQEGPSPEDIRRRMEFFNRIRSQMQEGGGGGEARGGGRGGDTGGRGGDRGGDRGGARGGRGR